MTSLLLSLLLAQAPQPEIISETRTGMGTRLQVLVYTADHEGARAAIQASFAELERIEKLMSEWIPDSEISRINQAAGVKAVPVSRETFDVLTTGKAVAFSTRGAFAMTWAGLGGLWTFGQNAHQVPAPEAVAQRLPLLGDDKLELDGTALTAKLASPGMALGLGAIAKGYSLDRALAVLEARGFHDALAFAGGDIVVRGAKGDKPWTIGIQDPRAAGYFAVLPLRDKAISTSGDYERYFEKDGVRYHHILDPRTGYPAKSGARSVTIVGPDGITADSIATAVFVLGPVEGMKLVELDPRVEAVIVDQQNNVTISSGLTDIVRVVKPPTP